MENSQKNIASKPNIFKRYFTAMKDQSAPAVIVTIVVCLALLVGFCAYIIVGIPKFEKLPPDFGDRLVFILQNRWQSYLNGTGTTMAIAIVSTFIGCIIGFAIGIVQTIPVHENDNIVKKVLMAIVRFILGAYVEIFRGTPMMVQAMFIYYGIPMIFGIHLSMWPAAIFIVSINTGAYMAETVRGGILSIDRGQTEGALAIGMTHYQTMINVILPQALRNTIPQIGNNLIINIKDTCVLSVISTVELFFATKGVAGAYYIYFESFTLTMIIYFVLTFTCSRLLRLWESKLDGPKDYDLATTDTLAFTSGMNHYKEKSNRNTNMRGSM